MGKIRDAAISINPDVKEVEKDYQEGFIDYQVELANKRSNKVGTPVEQVIEEAVEEKKDAVDEEKDEIEEYIDRISKEPVYEKVLKSHSEMTESEITTAETITTLIETYTKFSRSFMAFKKASGVVLRGTWFLAIIFGLVAWFVLPKQFNFLANITFLVYVILLILNYLSGVVAGVMGVLASSKKYPDELYKLVEVQKSTE